MNTKTQHTFIAESFDTTAGHTIEQALTGDRCLAFFDASDNCTLGANENVDWKTNGGYFLASYDTNGDNIPDRYDKSIVFKKVKALTVKCYTEFKPHIVEVKDYKLVYDSDYLLRLSMVSNAFFENKGNELLRSFSYKTEEDGPNNEPDYGRFVRTIIELNKKYNDDYVKIEALDTSGNVIPEANIQSWADSHPNTSIGLRFTFGRFSNVDAKNKFANPTAIVGQVYFSGPGTEGATIETTQEVQYEEVDTTYARRLDLENAIYQGHVDYPLNSNVIGSSDYNYLVKTNECFHIIMLKVEADKRGFANQDGNDEVDINILVPENNTGLVNTITNYMEQLFELSDVGTCTTTTAPEEDGQQEDAKQ